MHPLIFPHPMPKSYSLLKIHRHLINIIPSFLLSSHLFYKLLKSSNSPTKLNTPNSKKILNQIMSDVSANPSFHLSKPTHKLSSKQVLLKNKPTKKIGRSRNKNNNKNLMMNNIINDTTTSFSNTTTNKPLKVVHISNPMKFQATAAEFRTLVQELTGRDAVVEWPEEQHHHHHQIVAAAADVAEDDSSANSTDDQVSHQDDHHHEEAVNLSACFGPSDHHLMSFDYFGAHFNGEHMDDMGYFRAFISDDDAQSLLH